MIPRYWNQGNRVVEAPEPRPDSAWDRSGNGSTTKSTKGTKQASNLARSQAVPAGSVAGCPIAWKLSGRQRDSMRAGRPRSRVGHPPHPKPYLFLIHIDAQDFSGNGGLYSWASAIPHRVIAEVSFPCRSVPPW